MDKLDVAERLAVASSIGTLNAESKNTQAAISTLSGEVRAGFAQGNQQNTEILKCIAVLTSKSEDSTKYQDECDKDRKSIRDDVRRDYETLEKKVNTNALAINTLKTRTVTMSGILSAGISLVGLAATFGTIWATIHTAHP